VDYAVNGGVFIKYPVQGSFVGDIDIVEGWPPAAEQLYPIHGNCRGVAKVVDNHDIISMLEKG
jgi:hypothetical protein